MTKPVIYLDRGRKSAEKISREVRKGKLTIALRRQLPKILFRSQKPQPRWIAAVPAAEVFKPQRTQRHFGVRRLGAAFVLAACRQRR